MDKTDRIFVAGARGLVGAAIVRLLAGQGYANVLAPDRRQLDLTDATAVEDFFQAQRPDYVFMAAGKVGGIHPNSTYPAEFIAINLAIALNTVRLPPVAG